MDSPLFSQVVMIAAPFLSTECLWTGQIDRLMRIHAPWKGSTLLVWCAVTVIASAYLPTACLCRLDQVSRRAHSSVLELVLRCRARDRGWTLPEQVPEDDMQREGRRASWVQYLLTLESPPYEVPVLIVVCSDDGDSVLHASEANFLRSFKAQQTFAIPASHIPPSPHDPLGPHDPLMSDAFSRRNRTLRFTVQFVSADLLNSHQQLHAFMLQQAQHIGVEPLTLFFTRRIANHLLVIYHNIKHIVNMMGNPGHNAFRGGQFERPEARLDDLSRGVWAKLGRKLGLA